MLTGATTARQPRAEQTEQSGARVIRAGGGPDGNERLTALTGSILVVLLAVIGVTILRIGQLISVHLFVGLMLIGPVALKLASTGYRFTRYYAGDREYRLKGPPQLPMRLIAPLVVLTTVTVFISGVLLMFAGSQHRSPLLPIHKVSFIVWIVFAALHVLGHLPRVLGVLRPQWRSAAMGRLPQSVAGSWRAAAGSSESVAGEVAGRGGRGIAIAGALVGGLVLAIVLIPHFSAWSGHLAALRDR